MGCQVTGSDLFPYLRMPLDDERLGTKTDLLGSRFR